jgi:uncharacterized membrane protein YhaH (DUF805 family)
MTRYFDFSRMANRSEYWAVLILVSVAAVVLTFVSLIPVMADPGAGMVLLSILLILIMMIVGVWLTLAVSVARCRSAGINPWWCAALILPYVGFVVMIVLGCLAPQTKAVTNEQ